MFLQLKFIPTCYSSTPAFIMMCSAYRSNKQSDTFLNPEPVNCSIQGSNCCFLTRIHISQETGKMVWYSYLLKSFPQFVMIHTIKGFVQSVKQRELFLKFPCFLYDATNVGNLISGSSAFSKLNLDTQKFLAGITVKLSMQNIKNDIPSMGDEYNCPIV